ncbi:MAG: DUF2652 domain-containing protein [Bacteroidota bacterium]
MEFDNVFPEADEYLKIQCQCCASLSSINTMSSFNNKSESTLIFIPDISGYTKFVSTTEIHHARHILDELLELLMDTNEIGMELSEIEGDALLYYRKGKAPTVAEMLGQVQKMYVHFHEYLKKFELHRICSCGACKTAHRLTIKFVAHYGEVAENKVKGRSVLFGKEVIVAHRLLKNEINSNAYGLFSRQLMEASETWKNLPQKAWSEVVEMEEEYDFGKANYTYLELEPLLAKVPDPEPVDYSVPGATEKIIEVEQLVEAPLDMAFDVISDYSFRHEYADGLLDSDMLNHKITQNGSTHRCVIKRDESDPFFISHGYSFDEKEVTFAESSQKNNLTTVYRLTAVGPNRTRIQLTIFTKPNFFKLLLFNLFIKKKVVKSSIQTLFNFNGYCKKLIAENRQHPNQIVLPKEVVPVH